MPRCLMLAKWFNLSDPGIEEALLDRLSFRSFVGLSRADGTPDETAFGRFRARLGWRRVRSRGLERSAMDFALLLTATNLMHSLSPRPKAA